MTTRKTDISSLLRADGLDIGDLWGGGYEAPALVRGVPELSGAMDAIEAFVAGERLEEQDKLYSLPGAALDWREWLGTVAPHIRVELMAVEHVRMWRWLESIRLGVRPPAYFSILPRGYGKTTTGRLGMARVCVRAVRRFGLYVCGTTASANASVTSIRAEFERQGIGRKESRYGHSMGWSSERLVTENGFTLVALGLDQSNIRGLNLDQYRPDLIIYDDIDGLSDSPEVSDKKLDIISSTIIPAGSRDCAHLVTQNDIHGHGVVYRARTGEAGILKRRIVSFTVAVRGLRVESRPRERLLQGAERREDGGWSWADAEGDFSELDAEIAAEVEGLVEPDPGVTEDHDDELHIVEGESTWPGKSLAEWEEELNAMGETAFRREMQGQLGAGGLYFNFYATKQHVDKETGELSEALDWHVCDMPRILPHWIIEAGGDYGTAAHHAIVIGALDEYGVLYCIGEEGIPNRTDKQQALSLLLKLEELNLASGIDGVIAVRDETVDGKIRALDRDQHEQPIPTRLNVFALDPADTMPPEGKSAQTAQERMSEYPVEVFRRYGIPVVRAQKAVVAGLAGLREAMNRTVTYPKTHPTEPGRTVPKLRIVKGACPNFQRYLETAIKDPADENRAVAARKLEHFGDAGRYLRMRGLESPVPKKEDETIPLASLPPGLQAAARRHVATKRNKGRGSVYA